MTLHQWFVFLSTSNTNPMMTSSNGSIFRVTSLLCGEFIGHRWIPRTNASDTGFDILFDLRLSKWLNKQSKRRCFEAPSRSLWRHRNALIFQYQPQTTSRIKTLLMKTALFVSIDLNAFQVYNYRDMYLYRTIYHICYVALSVMGGLCQFLYIPSWSEIHHGATCPAVRLPSGVNWTLRNTFRRNFNQNTKLFMHLKMSSAICLGVGKLTNHLRDQESGQTAGTILKRIDPKNLMMRKADYNMYSYESSAIH